MGHQVLSIRRSRQLLAQKESEQWANKRRPGARTRPSNLRTDGFVYGGDAAAGQRKSQGAKIDSEPEEKTINRDLAVVVSRRKRRQPF